VAWDKKMTFNATHNIATITAEQWAHAHMPIRTATAERWWS
jgi:hypothetical protein